MLLFKKLFSIPVKYKLELIILLRILYQNRMFVGLFFFENFVPFFIPFFIKKKGKRIFCILNFKEEHIEFEIVPGFNGRGVQISQ